MNITARKYERRKQAQQQREAYNAEQFRELLQRAIKATGAIKSRSPINVDKLSPERQAELLEAYAESLEIEAREFELTYPDKDGQGAARWIRLERSSCLDGLAKLRIQITKASYEPRKPELV